MEKIMNFFVQEKRDSKKSSKGDDCFDMMTSAQVACAGGGSHRYRATSAVIAESDLVDFTSSVSSSSSKVADVVFARAADCE